MPKDFPKFIQNNVEDIGDIFSNIISKLTLLRGSGYKDVKAMKRFLFSVHVAINNIVIMFVRDFGEAPSIDDICEFTVCVLTNFIVIGGVFTKSDALVLKRIDEYLFLSILDMHSYVRDLEDLFGDDEITTIVSNDISYIFNFIGALSSCFGSEESTVYPINDSDLEYPITCFYLHLLSYARFKVYGKTMPPCYRHFRFFDKDVKYGVNEFKIFKHDLKKDSLKRGLRMARGRTFPISGLAKRMLARDKLHIGVYTRYTPKFLIR